MICAQETAYGSLFFSGSIRRRMYVADNMNLSTPYGATVNQLRQAVLSG